MRSHARAHRHIRVCSLFSSRSASHPTAFFLSLSSFSLSFLFLFACCSLVLVLCFSLFFVFLCCCVSVALSLSFVFFFLSLCCLSFVCFSVASLFFSLLSFSWWRGGSQFDVRHSSILDSGFLVGGCMPRVATAARRHLRQGILSVVAVS